MKEHAPGPWKRYAPQPSRNPAHEIRDTEGRYVASVEIHAHNNASVDAALIAAAPELLAACEALLGYVESDYEINAGYFGSAEEDIRTARAAIKKARG